MTVEQTPSPTPEQLNASPFDEHRNDDEDLIVKGEDNDGGDGRGFGPPPGEDAAAVAAATSTPTAAAAEAVVGQQETESLEEAPAVVSCVDGTDTNKNNHVDVVVGSEKNNDEGDFATSSSVGDDGGIEEEEEDTDNYDSSSKSNVNSGHDSGSSGNDGGDNKSKATDCLTDVQAIIAGDCTDDEEGDERNGMKKKKKKNKNQDHDLSSSSTANMMLEDVVLRPTSSLLDVGGEVVGTATDAVVAVAVATAAAAAAAASTSEAPAPAPAPAPTPAVSGEGGNESESEKASPVAGRATPPLPPLATKNDNNVQDKLCGTTIDGSSVAAANTLDCCDNFCTQKKDAVLEEEEEQVIVGIVANNANTNDDSGSKYLVSNMMKPLPGSHRQQVEQFKDEEELGDGGGGSMASGNTYYNSSRDVIIPYGIERNNTNASSFIRSISSSFSSNKNNINGGGVTMISRFRNMFTGGLNHQNNDVNKKESGGVNSSNPNEDTFIGDDGIILDGIDRSQMYNNSILDMESVVCDDDEDDKDVDGDDFAVGRCRVKRDPHQMRWIVLMCCIIHLVLVSLIIGFAVISRQEESTTPSVSIDNNSNSNEGGSSVVEEVSATAVPSSEATTPEKDGMMDNPDSPTVVENIEPTCDDTLEVSASCFSTNTGGDILVFFRSCTPEPGDWLGVYEASGQPTSMSVRVSDIDAVDWLFTCGDQECQDPIGQEVVPFQQVNGRYEAGKLYQVHMFRDGDGPMYSSFASSPPFQIVDGAVDCTV